MQSGRKMTQNMIKIYSNIEMQLLSTHYVPGKTSRRGKKGGQRKVGLNIEQTLVFNRYMYNLNLCIDNISLPRSITNRNKMLPMQIHCTTI